jgi:hypothetical protein
MINPARPGPAPTPFDPAPVPPGGFGCAAETNVVRLRGSNPQDPLDAGEPEGANFRRPVWRKGLPMEVEWGEAPKMLEPSRQAAAGWVHRKRNF